MSVLYLDIFSGLSGDMFLGAMLDLGVDQARLQTELDRLRLPGWHAHTSRASKCGITGTRFEVHLETGSDPGPDPAGKTHQPHHPPHPHPHPHPHAHGPEGGFTFRGFGPIPKLPQPTSDHDHGHGRTHRMIRELISQSELAPWVRERALAVFQRIALAEGKIHGVPPEEVHFHEVGAIDSIIDIVGACVALDALGRPRVRCAPVVDGTGWIQCAHGRLPLPAPATLEILGARGIPLTQCDEPHELVTPTGAGLLAEFAEDWGPMHDLAATRVGYGIGMRDLASRPNVVRAMLCAEPAPPHDWERDEVVVLETNLDDLSPEILGAFMDRALKEGALDVLCTPVQMKKNRPGVVLTLLCAAVDAERLAALVLTETSAFGVRRHAAARWKLRREFVPVETAYGAITVKLGRLDGRVVQAAPEFESCREAAARCGIPVRVVFDAARQAYLQAQP